MSSSTVGINIWLSEFCRTNPSLRRTSARLRGITSRPSTKILPSVCDPAAAPAPGPASPKSSFMTVDLPAPLAPISPTFSPFLISKETSEMTGFPFS